MRVPVTRLIEGSAGACLDDPPARQRKGIMLTTCSNPRCTCSPCLCGDDCKCGGTKLGELERQVMDVLWSHHGDEVTGRQVANALPGYAYTTVATVLNRLSRKGAVRRRMEGHTTHFSAIGTEADRAAAAMREALETSGDHEGALARFAETMSPHEAEALRRALSSQSLPSS